MLDPIEHGYKRIPEVTYRMLSLLHFLGFPIVLLTIYDDHGNFSGRYVKHLNIRKS